MWTIEEAVLHQVCLLDAAYVPLYISLVVMGAFSAVVPSLSRVSAHGKTRQSSGNYWFSCREAFLIEKVYFRHFYLTGLVSLICCILLVLVPTSLDEGSLPSICTLTLLGIHMSRRYYECQRVHQWQEGSKMHILGYILGIGHYVWLPMVFVKLPCFNFRCEILKGMHSADLPTYLYGILHNIPIYFFGITPQCDSDEPAQREMLLETNQSVTLLRPILVLLCLWAQYQQHRHHVLLAGLRGHPKKGTCSKYSSPVGGWFEYISCPHYLAEILIYVSFSLLLECEETLPNGNRHWLMLLFVTVNLAVSSRQSHEWYRRNFRDYDKLGRKALIPFLY